MKPAIDIEHDHLVIVMNILKKIYRVMLVYGFLALVREIQKNYFPISI